MAKITIARDGSEYECADGTKFLDVCQESGAPHEFGCTIGSCGTCLCVLDAGAENVDPPTDDERETVDMMSAEDGARLACQLVVRGDVTIRQL